MPLFDFGFNFRDTLGYVTDPAYAAFVRDEAYPHLYTNGNGLTINAGFTTQAGTPLNRNHNLDPIIAGFYFVNNDGIGDTFTVDLSSGSNPGVGVYQVRLGFGEGTQNRLPYFEVLDNATIRIDGTNGGAGTLTAALSALDASLTNQSVLNNPWINTPVSVSFTTTTVKLKVGHAPLGNQTPLDHFRLTFLSGASGSVFLPRWPRVEA